MRKSWKKVQRYFDQKSFAKNQADYFLYLSQLLRGTQGRYTVRSVFAADAQRYGSTSYRGRLSAYWLENYQHNGGDLAKTWQGVLSADEWLLVSTAQMQGDQALLMALELLAEKMQKQKQLQQQLVQLFWPVGFACALLMLMLFLMPWFTVPQLKNTFYAVPEEFYGTYTIWLFEWAKFSQNYGAFLIALLVGALFLIIFSLPVYKGSFRQVLDYIEPWKSYKSIQGLRFLLLLSLLLKDASRQLRLGPALQLIERSPNPWLKHYLSQIQYRISQGDTGADSFDVGLFSKEVLWFLSDMEKSQGLSRALALSAQRLHGVIERRLPLKAQIWRWVMLLGCVGFLLLIGGWHYVVIDELRGALLMLYASQ